MEPEPLRLAVEVAHRRTFAIALERPGWARAGKDEPLAIEALLAAAPRYASVAERAGVASIPDPARIEIAERLVGGSGTDFGVPSAIAEADRAPVDRAEAERLAAIVAAAWATFDEVTAAAPEALRKGPRGGGRDRSKIVAHVVEADAAYAREIGIRLRPAVPRDDAGIAAMRAAMLDVLRAPSDGSPLAGRHWPQRYAARRIAWHALDHAWEIEDRSEP